jgi:uncharacterized damage-inducible protein DinB
MKYIEKPGKEEYAEYAGMYIDLLPADGQVLHHLNENFITVKTLALSLTEDQLMHRYAPGKWTIREVLVHLVDDERIYAYRALRFARNDRTELPGFEQDHYTIYSGANERTLPGILEEYESVRKATLTLFNNFDDEALLRSGIADNRKSSVRALAYHIAGHELHHLKIIKEKYL